MLSLSSAPSWNRFSSDIRKKFAILDCFPHIPKRYGFAAYNRGEDYYHYWDRKFNALQTHNFYLGDYMDSGAHSYCFDLLPRDGKDKARKLLRLLDVR